MYGLITLLGYISWGIIISILICVISYGLSKNEDYRELCEDMHNMV